MANLKDIRDRIKSVKSIQKGYKGDENGCSGKNEKSARTNGAGPTI